MKGSAIRFRRVSKSGHYKIARLVAKLRRTGKALVIGGEVVR